MVCSSFRLISRISPTFCRTRRACGFTLVELLVVIAILGIMMAVVAPSLPSMLGAKAIGKAANEVAAVLERARAEAMSRRTYVYVGFLNTTNAAGNSELRIGAVSSLDGTANVSDTTDPKTDNLREITRVISIENMQMTDLSGLPQSVRKLAPADLSDEDFISRFPLRFPTSEYVDVDFKVGKVDFRGKPVIIFSPQGEILPPPRRVDPNSASFSFLPSASIGLVPTRKTTPLKDGSDGAIVTYRGGSGRIEITRP